MKTKAVLIQTAHSRILDINAKIKIQFTLFQKESDEKMRALLDIQIEALKNERDFWEQKFDTFLKEL